MAKLDHILAEFKAAVAQRCGERLARLICYGSVTRGEAGPESDVDLALVLKGEMRPSVKLMGLSTCWRISTSAMEFYCQ